MRGTAELVCSSSPRALLLVCPEGASVALTAAVDGERR